MPLTPLLEQLIAQLDASEWFWLQVNEMNEVAAYESARRLSPFEWSLLEQVWRGRSLDWQRCFANVIAEVGPPQAETWLLEMIEQGHETLALQATEDFRALQKQRPAPTPVPEATIHRIRTMWRKHHRFTAEQLHSLLEDLAHPRQPP